MATMKPFANESDSINIGDMTVENRLDQIEMYGNLAITRDKEGLKLARELKALVDATVSALESDKNLPDQLPPPQSDSVKNPFA
jgi:hypothetical protein